MPSSGGPLRVGFFLSSPQASTSSDAPVTPDFFFWIGRRGGFTLVWDGPSGDTSVISGWSSPIASLVRRGVFFHIISDHPNGRLSRVSKAFVTKEGHTLARVFGRALLVSTPAISP